ncbi:MAG: protein-L-isoaspartate(D-aspartate) O-methyltransferase [Candidatus Hydrothermarchaeaceae archaeon]
MYEKEREAMIEKLIASGYLRSDRVIDAMRTVYRHQFLPRELWKYAYDDTPLPIGKGQTISAPHMVAIMCEALELGENQKVLEIGAGSGYHACVVAHITGCVFTVERVRELADVAEENIKRAGCTGVEIIIGDGTEGYEKEAPYDRILVTAGAPDIPPELLRQLRVGGILLIPLGSRFFQELVVVHKKSEKDAERRNLGGCAFVPLVGKHGW